MCGITGILNFDETRNIDRNLLKQMNDTIAHRGPDGEGIFINNNIGLGHRRLAIIDLETGDQPFFTRDKSMVLVFNGEIYNYKELKKILINKGHFFRTESDTEVLIHGYEQFEEGILNQLQGMFAFAIWDEKHQKLFIARDRFGIKPLYYYVDKEKFIFASEIKSILMDKSINITPCNGQLYEYMIFRDIQGSNTLFKNIHKLEPGNYIEITNSNVNIKSYYNLTINSCNEFNCNDFNDKFEQSVKYRLISDVPVGTFNSGGLDSSLVSAVAAKHFPNIHTFNVSLNTTQDNIYDESFFASTLSQHIKSKNTIYYHKKHEFFRDMVKLTWHQDAPLVHPTSIPLYNLFKIARKSGIKVILSGEGSDELFAGYSSFHTMLKIMLARKFPLSGLVQIITSNMMKKEMSRYLKGDKNDYIIYSSGYNQPHYLKKLFRNISCIETSLFKRRQLLEDVEDKTNLQRKLYYYQKSYVIHLLDRMDKMSMATGVECRVPFLDHNVVEYANFLRDGEKIALFGNNKLPVRKLCKRYVPSIIYKRPKVAFSCPITKWLINSNVNNIIRFFEEFKDDILIENGLYTNANIIKLIKERKLTADLLWTIMSLRIWYNLFITNKLGKNYSLGYI